MQSHIRKFRQGILTNHLVAPENIRDAGVNKYSLETQHVDVLTDRCNAALPDDALPKLSEPV